MRASAALSLIAATAALSAAGTARADDGRELRYMGPTSDGPDTDFTPQRAVSNIIYVNRCVGGCTITFGLRNNSTTDTSWFPDNGAGTTGEQYHLTEFSHDDATWNAIMECVRDVYSPYNVTVTDVDPGTTSHTEIYAAGLDSEVGINGAGGVGGAVSQTISLESACSGGENGVAFAFLNGYPASQVEYMCAVIAQETGHTFGLLDHHRDCRDPMSASYNGPCNGTDRNYFRNTAQKCGDAAAGPCVCGGNFVNSHSHLSGTFGETGNVQDPPTVEILSPADGAHITDATKFGADGAGPRGIFKIDLFMNGWPWGNWTGADNPDPGTWPPPNYLITPDSGLPDGNYDVELRAYDDLGTAGSATISVVKGAPCTDASSCLDGQKCEGGKCFWDQPTGQLGDECTYDQFCEGPHVFDGKCVTDSTGVSACTRDCTSGPLDDCGDGFYCLETNASTGAGVCWKAQDSGGCCSAGHEDGRQLAGMIGLVAVVGLLTMRRRQGR